MINGDEKNNFHDLLILIEEKMKQNNYDDAPPWLDDQEALHWKGGFNQAIIWLLEEMAKV